MFNALSELRKYRRIDLKKPISSEVPAHEKILQLIAEDINRTAKNQYKLGQQFEGFSEQILETLEQEIHTLKKTTDVLLGQLDESKTIIEKLLLALISLSDALDIIQTCINASGDSDWISQMKRLRDSADRLLTENGLLALGYETYFDDTLHEAVDTIQDTARAFKEITGMEKKGYSYRGKVLRKARVIVNTRRKDESSGEQDHRN